MLKAPAVRVLDVVMNSLAGNARTPEATSPALSRDGSAPATRTLPLGRMEAFSDGVFAIAITLLVIELHVPTGHEGLAAGLAEEWPRYLGYLVSFAFIGGVWMAHSNMTSFIKAVDATLMRLNLLLLLLVSLLPFTTAVVATHLFVSFLAVEPRPRWRSDPSASQSCCSAPTSPWRR